MPRGEVPVPAGEISHWKRFRPHPFQLSRAVMSLEGSPGFLRGSDAWGALLRKVANHFQMSPTGRALSSAGDQEHDDSFMGRVVGLVEAAPQRGESLMLSRARETHGPKRSGTSRLAKSPVHCDPSYLTCWSDVFCSRCCTENNLGCCLVVKICFVGRRSFPINSVELIFLDQNACMPELQSSGCHGESLSTLNMTFSTDTAREQGLL